MSHTDKPSALPTLHLWPRFEDALEHCETALLASLGRDQLDESIASTLLELGRNHPRSAELLSKMERRQLKPNEVLIKASETTADIYFLVSGYLAVHLPSPTGMSRRVRSLAHGAIVGEVAYLTGQPRSADVICESESEVLCMRETTIRKIEKSDPELAALLMSILCRSLAAKLSQTNLQLAYAQSGTTREV